LFLLVILSLYLVLLGVSPDLFTSNPIFPAYLGRPQTRGLDHFAHRFHMHLQEICDFCGNVKVGAGLTGPPGITGFI
jgi:hypothetical protein